MPAFEQGKAVQIVKAPLSYAQYVGEEGVIVGFSGDKQTVVVAFPDGNEATFHHDELRAK